MSTIIGEVAGKLGLDEKTARAVVADFALQLHRHALEYKGGNGDFIGWDLVGYPGLRMSVTEDEQRMQAPKSVRRSAYNEAMFAMTGAAHGNRP